MTSRLTPTLNSRSAASTASALIRVDAPPPTVGARLLVSVEYGSGLFSVAASACHSVALERAPTRLKKLRFFLWRWTSLAVLYRAVGVYTVRHMQDVHAVLCQVG